jgi:hypothetical protein
VSVGVELRPRQLLAVLDGADPALEAAAQHADAGVGQAEMLERVNRHRPLADLRLVVGGHALAFLAAALDSRLAEEVDLVEPHPAAVALAAAVERRVEVPPADDLAAGVVDRHGPLGDAGAREEQLAVGVLVDVGRLRDAGKERLGRAHPDVVAPAPRVGQEDADAVFHPVPLDDRQRAPGGVEMRARHAGVQEHRMERVHRVLCDLQPVTRIVDGIRHHVVGGLRHGVEDREFRHAVSGAEIGEDQPADLVRRIGALADLVLERALRRLAGRLEHASVDVEQPAVVAAADTVLRDDAVFERGAPVCTMLVQQADPARQVAEDHQVLAEHPDHQRQVGQLRRHRDRMPEAAHVLAAGRPATDPRQRVVRGGIERQVIAAEFRDATGHA